LPDSKKPLTTTWNPVSILQLVNALIKADKQFDFLMVPSMAHSSGDTYGERKRRDFFVRHLLGVEPPAWDSLAKDRADN